MSSYDDAYDDAREAAIEAFRTTHIRQYSPDAIHVLLPETEYRINAAIDAFLAKLSADSEMVERVAKAIHSARQSRGFSGSAAWEYEPANILELYRATARAAIAAMLTTAPAPASQQATPAK